MIPSQKTREEEKSILRSRQPGWALLARPSQEKTLLARNGSENLQTSSNTLRGPERTGLWSDRGIFCVGTSLMSVANLGETDTRMEEEKKKPQKKGPMIN